MITVKIISTPTGQIWSWYHKSQFSRIWAGFIYTGVPNPQAVAVTGLRPIPNQATQASRQVCLCAQIHLRELQPCAPMCTHSSKWQAHTAITRANGAACASVLTCLRGNRPLSPTTAAVHSKIAQCHSL